MAVIQYEILGKVIDMTNVTRAVESGDLLGVLAALENALDPVTNDRDVITTLGRRIMNSGALPTEKEIENIVSGRGATTVITSNVHPNFPVPKQNAVEESVPKCPTCQSTNIERIGAVTRGVAAGLFGLFSSTARSQFVCENCGYKW